MTDAELRQRLWEGFAALQTLLGGSAKHGFVIEKPGLVASVVPSAPDSPALNAAVAIEPETAPRHLEELEVRYGDAGVRRWAIWVDGGARSVTAELRQAGMGIASASPGMGAAIADLDIDLTTANPAPNANLQTVGRVNDLAYGYSEPKLAPAIAALPPTALQTYGITLQDETACVATAFDVGDDTAVWFVATLPHAQRNGLAAGILRRLLLDARERGQRTASLQASPKGRALYERLGFRPVGSLHLYEERFS